jgi:NAD+ synthase (glutamine-hydrolysing)
VKLKVVLAQLDFIVGDIPGNTDKVCSAIEKAKALHNFDVIVFPELTLTGYPPEDLLLRASMQKRVEVAILQVCQVSAQLGADHTVVLGYPWHDGKQLYNAAGVFCNGQLVTRYYKHCLPNYQVFDEKRYFAEGNEASCFYIKGVSLGVTICEDLWHEAPAAKAKAAGAQILLNLNASPFHMGKLGHRKKLVASRALQNNFPIVYVNLVGGQDELIFDGGSMVFDQQGNCSASFPQFTEALYLAEIDTGSAGEMTIVTTAVSTEELSLEQSVYQALVLGVRDYVNKNGFRSVVLGLSGGIDSALTLAIAVDALGADRVRAVMMPFTYTSQMSIEDAAEEAAILQVQYDVISIEPIYNSFMGALAPAFTGLKPDTTEENLQARCRGVLLMSLSNKTGSLVLTTGNKSEMAVGYSTLYGDMAGGFDVLKDVPKTLVFKLATYRNSVSHCIPQRVIDRPPSAELAPDQKDEDSLPPYDILDEILRLYVEKDQSAASIIEMGFDKAQVERVVRLVDVNEYKRRQAPIGVRITERGFGKDRRYPITNGWKMGS